MKLIRFALVTLVSGFGISAQAQVGSISFSDIGTTTASPSGDINTATSYTLGEVINNSDGTGVFAGLGSQLFGSVTFSPQTANSFNFSNPVFGSFASTSIYVVSQAAGTITYNILGTYNSGSFDGGTIVNDPASYTLNFNQNPPSTGSIGDSATFSIPPVPEPGSVALLGMGVGAVLVHLRRRIA